MDKKTLLLLGVAAVLIIGVSALLLRPQKSLSSPLPNKLGEKVSVVPSKTLKTYTDPSGFSFNYPDNLSLLNNELKDAQTYAELQLIAKGVDGNLSLKISDSKLKSIDAGKEVNLGNLKAREVESKDKIMLSALDKGVLFNIEVNFGGNKDFWTSVYSSVLQDFSFTQPSEDTTVSGGADSSDAVSFEGEEVIE